MLSANPNLIETFVLGVTALTIIGIWTVGLLYFYSRCLRETISEQSQELRELRHQLAEITLASMAFKASNETHAMTGPAVLQQLKKSPVDQDPQAKPAPKSGVRMRQGV